MTTQVARDLRAAAEVLRRDGWTRGFYTDPETGAHCAVGAIRSAISMTDSAPMTPALNERWDALEVVLNGEGATFWNDAPGRTADEVIAALEAAADAAEAQA